jgi:Protein of unknown function (DUF4038)/Putative collagen-binding domain of a collagenase
VFPLMVKRGQRYLVDARGRPFLIHGDTAWSLMAQLIREEVELYLDDRRARGFNTLLVSLIENHYSADPPANAYGERPFHNRRFAKVRRSEAAADFAKPNEAYFAHADWVVRRAAEMGFLVLLAPCYVGCCGDGWYEEMVANGPDRLHEYGRYLGRRYRHFTNILWVHAGDANPPNKGLVRAIAEGIREFDSRSLHSAHGAPWTPAIDYWEGEPWLQVNNVYTAHPDAWSDHPVHAATLEQYTRPEPMPFFLIEGVYENMHGANERQLRTQAYQALLCGAAGHVFGNDPIWHFDMPGYSPAPAMTWQEALGSRGAQSMAHLRELLVATGWWKLRPDLTNAVLTDGLGPAEDRAVAACSTDRSFALVYLPSSRPITVDLGQLAGRHVAAHWYDPSNGQSIGVDGSPFRAQGSRRLQPTPERNGSGFDDWVLILGSRS